MKKISSCILAMIIAASVLVTPALAAWSPWAEYYVRDAEQLYDIIPVELSGGDYTLDITREQFCDAAYETMAYIAGCYDYYSEDRPLSYERKRIYLPSSASPFEDTASPAVAALSAVGIIKGKNAGVFAPDDTLTRAEAAIIAGRIADYFGLQSFDAWPVFDDLTALNSADADSLRAVCARGIMVGVGGGKFSPNEYFTREQAAAVMIRLIDAVPYMLNREVLSPDRSMVFNSFWLWIEDAEGNVIFKLPKYYATYDYRLNYGYDSFKSIEHGGRMLAAAFGSDAPADGEACTHVFDIEAGRELFRLPRSAGYVHSLSPDGEYIIMWDTLPPESVGAPWPTVYGVYDFNGKEIMATEHTWEELYAAGYVGSEF